jgi:hypothetical protein
MRKGEASKVEEGVFIRHRFMSELERYPDAQMNLTADSRRSMKCKQITVVPESHPHSY